MILERIEKTGDIKKIPESDLPALAGEIRSFLIETLSKKGGHLASSLGTVELTMALHRVFDLPEDKLIWDVGHQAYTHKILTGRKEDFATLRDMDGMSGFPKRTESDCDAFGTGHASTSISAGLGMVRARDLSGDDYHVISVIGDGALTGGMAFEGLNNCGALKTNFIIVLNDNNMSISENVGGMAVQLSHLRTSKGYTDLKDSVQSSLEKIPVYGEKIVAKIRRTKSGIKQLVIPGMVFEELGIMYLGPVDGHNIPAMEDVFRRAASFEGPVLVHVVTKKGRGYAPAERHPSRFHGAEPFEIESGLPLNHKDVSYSDIFSTVMLKMGERDEKVCAVTAAMMDGTGLKRFHNRFPERFFDVGIAEEHAVTFAAGLAADGWKPVVAIYSSFLQRAYDQILHDVCLQDLPVVFAIDRAGIVGRDGPTHQGVFDIAFLSTIPNMMILAPKNKWELSDMLKFALRYGHPIAVRYPRGAVCTDFQDKRAKITVGKCEELISGDTVCILALGSMVEKAGKAVDLLAQKGFHPTLVNARFAKPIDSTYLCQAREKYKAFITIEDGVLSGGFGEQVLKVLYTMGYRGQVKNLGFPDEFIGQGDCGQLYEKYGLSAEAIAKAVEESYVKEAT